jgi:hypothetical protein
MAGRLPHLRDRHKLGYGYVLEYAPRIQRTRHRRAHLRFVAALRYNTFIRSKQREFDPGTRRGEKVDKPTIVTTSTTVSRTVSSVELDGEGAALVERLEEARKQISVYEAEKDEVTKALKERIGDADAASVNGVTRVVVQHVDSSNIDRKMLSELVAPEIVAKITKPNPYSYLKTLKA